MESGSLPIFELFVVDDEIAEMINQRKSKVDIAHLARSKGMLSLSQEALLRFYQGFIDFESIKNYVFSPSY